MAKISIFESKIMIFGSKITEKVATFIKILSVWSYFYYFLAKIMIFGNKIINKIPKILNKFFKYLGRILNIILTHLEFIGLLTGNYLN